MSRTGERNRKDGDEDPDSEQPDDRLGLLMDDGDPDEEATAVARQGDDADDENRTMEEQAMHLTKPPPFHDTDGYFSG